MNTVNPGNNPDTPPSIPVKRKRGRPRKDRTLNPKESVQVPPGFEGHNGKPTFQLDAIEDTEDSIVGQTVTGVVEAAFDAGYLLTVRVGNSNTSLRGVVFKSGHYLPISSENDVAPHAQMIRRNEIPFPMDNQIRVHGRHPRPRDRNEQHGSLRRVETGHVLNGSPPTNGVSPRTADLVVSKGRHFSPLSPSPVPPVGARGTVVPVVLQPVSLLNASQPANQIPSIPPQAGQPADLLNESGPSHQGTREISHKEVQSMKHTTVSPSYEVKRVRVSSQSSEKHNEYIAVGKSGENPGHSLEGDVDSMNKPLIIEPLQVIHSHVSNRSESAAKPLENNRIGRMSELLQALQETENQAARVEKLATTTETDAVVEQTVELRTGEVYNSLP